MPVSTATVIGRLEPPGGADWQTVIASPKGRAEVTLAFHALAAAALRLRPEQVLLYQNVCVEGAGTPGMQHGHWHRDACKPIGHVLGVVGASPTEFLLGEFPEVPPEALGQFERVLRLWRPEPGEVVYITRDTIHRRPPAVTGNRMFLMGAEK